MEGWEIISHYTHCLLAGKIAMQLNHKLRPEYWKDVLTAIVEHDDYLLDFDERNYLTDAGAPMDFTLDVMSAEGSYKHTERICRAFIPQMLDLGWGRMVLVASENAFQPYPEESPYNACKAAIINLSKCLSRSYSKENLLFNCVSPAFIKTPMTDTMMEELAKKRDSSTDEAAEWFVKNKRPHIAMQRRGTPEEVAAVIAFLCSEKASFVNGSNYRVDGESVESAFG